MWHIAKSKASQSHTQHNLYVTDNREIVCSQNYTSTSTFFYLPIGHRTFHRHFLSILLFHFFWILRMRPESQSNPTDHSFFFFYIFSFFSQNVTDTQTIDHFQPKRQQQSLRPKTNYYLNMFKYWIMMKNEQRLHRKARTLLTNISYIKDNFALIIDPHLTCTMLVFPHLHHVTVSAFRETIGLNYRKTAPVTHVTSFQSGSMSPPKKFMS